MGYTVRMTDSKKTPQKGPTTEEEIRRGRKFSLSEAVGRQAAGAMKGASPVPRWRQVLQEIQSLLGAKLYDPEGSLQSSIAEHFSSTLPVADDPRHDANDVLRAYLQQTLASQTALAALVRRADIRWGQQYGEKPHFNQGTEPSHPDDPYTMESVTAALETLLQSLA